MLAWGFIPNFSCEDAATCTKANNWGWRYLVLSLGAVTFAMFICRFFLFTYYESPKFLVSRGRQDEAVAAVQGIARKNKTTTWLTEEVLNEICGHLEEDQSKSVSTIEVIKRSLERFSYQQVTSLFASKRLGISSTYVSHLESSHRLMITNSCPDLVLLDLHWNGLHPFQRLSAPIYGCQLFDLRDLPQLCHYCSLWNSGPTSLMGHGRYPIHWS